MTDIPLSTGLVPFTPAYREKEAKPPVYMIKPGTVIEREQLEAELAGPRWRAPRVFVFQELDAFANGIRALLPEGDDRARLLELVEHRRAGDELDAADEAVLLEADRIVMGAWPEYQMLLEFKSRRAHITPLLAFMTFVKGWKNVPSTYAAGMDGRVSESALSGVQQNDLRLVGLHVYNLLYAGGQEKNSVSPSKSESVPKISRSASKSPAGGKSTAADGKKTRAS